MHARLGLIWTEPGGRRKILFFDAKTAKSWSMPSSICEWCLFNSATLHVLNVFAISALQFAVGLLCRCNPPVKSVKRIAEHT